MSATGLDVFDRTLQTTNIWLDEIMQEIGPDRQVAWHVLRAVLHALRDRLPLGDTAHFAAQLPILVRGIYYDQWHPAGKPDRERHKEEFIRRIGSELAGLRSIDPELAARAVFKVAARHVTSGQIEKVKHALPGPIRALWPAGANSRSE